MHSITITLAALASIALALPSNTEVIQVRELVRPRQDTSIDYSSLYASLIPTGCAIPSSILSIEESVPTPPPALESALLSYTAIDYCDVPSLTGSIAAIYSSYNSEVVSWYDEHSAELMSWEMSYATACPIAASLYSDLTMGTAVNTAEFLSMATASCGGASGTGAAATTKTGSAASKTGSGSSGSATGSAAAKSGSASGSSATKSASGSAAAATTNAAAQPTVFAAAGLIAGLAGVVAAL